MQLITALIFFIGAITLLMQCSQDNDPDLYDTLVTTVLLAVLAEWLLK